MPTLKDLAQEGARIRLEQLREETNAIYRMFPRLKFVKKSRTTVEERSESRSSTGLEDSQPSRPTPMDGRTAQGRRVG
jgi:hypothetical protein